MPTGILTAAATGAATAGASGLMGKFFGKGDAPKVVSPPPGINAGGLTSNYSNGVIGMTADPNRTGLVNNISDTFGAQAGEIAGLRPLVAPGMSELRDARLSEIENARLNAIGNLRENLGRRRVLGSSFAQDASTRAEAEFGAQKERAAAESFLQELQLTNDLMQQEFTARRGQFTTKLDELNLEANIAATLAGKATDVLGKNAQTEALLAAQAQQGAGKFFGQLAEPIGKAAGKSFGDTLNFAVNGLGFA